MVMPKRTTVTFDDDVVEKLEDVARQSGKPFRAVLNETIRRGLAPPRRPPGLKPFKVRAQNLGARPDIDFDCISRLLDFLDRGEGR